MFDLEYAGATNGSSNDTSFAASTRSRRFNKFFGNARWLSDINTNARVYRSHADRAKRVVTESSPHLFLTCSEDGEVRQWDLRLPSSAYPRPRGGRGFGPFHRNMDDDVSDNVPPPLISYKKYNLDLNSISCAASQPQYIALGGAHLHCFLHDRRMLGRDLLNETGQSIHRRPNHGTQEDDYVAAATRCVKRFGPNNKRKMPGQGHGHITACKISDANPNEMVASWSGDHVYSFDIIRSPDARDADEKENSAFQTHRLRNNNERKRKRKPATASTSTLAETDNPSQRLRRVSDGQQEHGQTALRVRYNNGETEDVPLLSDVQEPGEDDESANSLLSEAQQVSERVARALVQLRKTIFDFSTELTTEMMANMESSSDLTPYTSTFTQVLGQCSTLLPEMDDIIRQWSYPINPSEDEVTLQNTLRRNRQASWRFVQAAGCLSYALGGNLQSLTSTPDLRLRYFDHVKPASREGRNISRERQFCYDFLRAILCWLAGGREAVLQAFVRPPSVAEGSPRFPLSENDTIDTFAPKLLEYLSDLADEEKPIIDLDTNRFERDETRHIFVSQRAAVKAFTRVLDEVHLQMRQGLSEDLKDQSPDSHLKRVMDKGAAARFWGVKVGRSLLMQGAEGVTFDFVNRAFGGLRLQVSSVESERSQEDVDPEEEDDRVIEAIDLVATTETSSESFQDSENQHEADSSSATPRTAREYTASSTRSDAEMVTPPTVMVEDVDDEEEHAEHDDLGEHENQPEESSDDEAHSDDGEDEDGPAQRILRRRIGYGRSHVRARVNIEVPYSSHTRVYKGHCNTRTVKDVNYYGLNDEYVVSGSDDGHFFIWDRKTTKVVNILEGDGEVVNVIQGHPYEPMIACSGIDSTIKIFGVAGENRERIDAARGYNVANPGGSVHSSLGYGRRRRRMRDDSDDEAEDDADAHSRSETKVEATNTAGLKSRRAMHKSYEIMSQNDVERQRGLHDAFATVSGTMEELFTRAWILSGFQIV